MRSVVPLLALTLCSCSGSISGRASFDAAIGEFPDDDADGIEGDSTTPRGNRDGSTPSGTDGGAQTDARVSGGSDARVDGGGGNDTGTVGQPEDVISTYPDVFDPNDSPPKTGEPGCGLSPAAFCDTFGGPSSTKGRAGELTPFFWSAGRMGHQQSTERPMSVGMAVIPQCRAGLPTKVWPNEDTLICQASTDIGSGHLLAACAAQNYGQNGYRIRQPFDFAGRTGKIAFDATLDPMSPLLGWISLAITDEPISMPGYAVYGNDEGTIIPRNAIEVHFLDQPGNPNAIVVRNVQLFRNYVDTVYTPPEDQTGASYKIGKLNHFEVLVSETGVEVKITPFSADGVKFGAATYNYKVTAPIPFSRGYVHLSVHNHATIKYSKPDSGRSAIVDAAVARFDNVGFDGRVFANWREYEVANNGAKFSNDPNFPDEKDPYNTTNTGVDLGWFVNDTAEGPRQQLTIKGVDIAGAKSAKVSFTGWMDFGQPNLASQFLWRVRLNGKAWVDRKLNAAEVAFFTKGPTVVDPAGKPAGEPATQGRLGFAVDVPLADVIAGDNRIEFVTDNIPTGYPPVVGNIDLILGL